MAIFIIFIISSFFLSHASSVDTRAKKLSFSVDYIHRDSPLSPFHNSSHTPYESLRESIDRDRFRLSSSKKSNDLSGSITSAVSPASFDYVMSISIGTPPFKFLALMDTGSDLNWMQCLPCDDCYPQDAPLFDPSRSSTFNELSCDFDEDCPAAFLRCGDDSKCRYLYPYTDGSYTKGVDSVDTFTFDSVSGNK
ncbi:Eukaryotic aspartyl protease family protein, partial [Zostera marina]